MNDKEKAAAVLSYMEDEWDGKAIINALNPYLRDEDLADLYDNLVDDGFLGPSIEEYLDKEIYRVETDADGNKVIHVDGYIYESDGRYLYQQAVGCFINVSEIKGLDYSRIIDKVEYSLDMCKQVVAEVDVSEASDTFEECEKLSFELVNEDTPDGVYINF